MLFTDADDVYGLLGPSSSFGASGGYLGYVAVDFVSFDDYSDMSGKLNGIQIGAGIGGGADVHVTESYTKELWCINISKQDINKE